MNDLKLAFGLRDMPVETTTAWGARWIYPNDVLWDRQDLQGPNADALKDWLNGGALNKARIEALRLAKAWQMFPSSDKTVVLYDDEHGSIVANPQASHGHLYVAAWLKEDIR